jgi:hypothetical protein
VKRWHQETAMMGRRARERRADFDRWGLQAEVSLGEMRKRHVHGCGRARCGLCHPSKRWHRQGDRARAEAAWRREELAA